MLSTSLKICVNILDSEINMCGLKSPSTVFQLFSSSHHSWSPLIPTLFSFYFACQSLPSSIFKYSRCHGGNPVEVRGQFVWGGYADYSFPVVFALSPVLWSISFLSCLCITLSAGNFTQPSPALLRQTHSWFRRCISTASVTLLWFRLTNVLTHWT